MLEPLEPSECITRSEGPAGDAGQPPTSAQTRAGAGSARAAARVFRVPLGEARAVRGRTCAHSGGVWDKSRRFYSNDVRMSESMGLLRDPSPKRGTLKTLSILHFSFKNVTSVPPHWLVWEKYLSGLGFGSDKSFLRLGQCQAQESALTLSLSHEPLGLLRESRWRQSFSAWFSRRQ